MVGIFLLWRANFLLFGVTIETVGTALPIRDTLRDRLWLASRSDCF
jgi:hypothetical protein